MQALGHTERRRLTRERERERLTDRETERQTKERETVTERKRGDRQEIYSDRLRQTGESSTD